jgi:predicted RNA-binding protein YlqC (UPF0109 family)
MDKERCTSEPDCSQLDQEDGEQSSIFGNSSSSSLGADGTTSSAVEDFAEYVLRALVSNDDGLEIIRESPDSSYTKISVKCSPNHAGKLIGKGGKTIGALRQLVRTMAQRQGKKVDIDILG